MTNGARPTPFGAEWMPVTDIPVHRPRDGKIPAGPALSMPCCIFQEDGLSKLHQWPASTSMPGGCNNEMVKARIVKTSLSIADFKRRFPTEVACQAFVERERWGDSPICPHCGHAKIYHVSGPMGFKCSSCRKRFSLRTGNAMEHSKLPLRTWLLAICMLTAPVRPRRSLLSWLLALYMTSEMRSSLPLARFAEQLEVTHKTALSLAERIRRACADNAGGAPGEAPATAQREKTEGRGNKRTITQLSETFGEAVAKVIRDRPAKHNG